MRYIFYFLLFFLFIGNLSAQTTWNGTVNTDWTNPGNWSADVPDATDDVTIPNTANKPTIGAGTAAVAKTIEVQSGTTLTIAAMASLTVNGSKSVPGGGSSAFLNDGIVQNNGQIILGNLSAIGGEGLYNRGTFNNNTNGDIKIDRSTFRAILNRDATFNNSGLITIGASASVGARGLNNFGTTAMFNNNTGGEIKIDNATSRGLFNESGTFTNAAKITIGATTSIGGEGIINADRFNNNSGGDIKIDRSTFRAILNFDATLNFNAVFNNSGLITIGASASVGVRGLDNFGKSGKTSTFNNDTGGEIKIDNATSYGLGNAADNSVSTFNNAAKITIGATTSTGSQGIYNASTFNNNSGGDINIDRLTSIGLYNQSGTFTNAAKITIGAVAGAGMSGISNEATFTNSPCTALIDIRSNNDIKNTSTSTNAGRIIENASGNSNISSNTGIVQNFNGGTFTIDSGKSPTTFVGELSACCPTATLDTLYVNPINPTSGDFSTWGNAYTKLQDALSFACSCPNTDFDIWVAKGTYYPDEGVGRTDNNRDEPLSYVRASSYTVASTVPRLCSASATGPPM
jgi:hypothetical protein